MEFIKKHKAISIICLIILIVLIMLYMFIRKLSPDVRKSLYGNRLIGIEDIQIKKDKTNNIINDIKKNEGIKDASYNLKGRLINIIVNINNDLSQDKAKEYANKILEYFSDKEKEFYDMQIFFITNDKSEQYPIIGYKHKTSKTFVWKQ